MLSLREMGLDPQKDNISIQAIGDSTVIAQALATGIIDGAALDKLQSVQASGAGSQSAIRFKPDRSSLQPLHERGSFHPKESSDGGELYQGNDRGERPLCALRKKGASPFFKNISRQIGKLAEMGYKLLLDDLTPYTFVTVKGLKTVRRSSRS